LIAPECRPPPPHQVALSDWKQTLASLAADPKIATLHLNRNELARQFANFHRFSPVNAEFDCGFPRVPTPFATIAKDQTDWQIQVEDCWRSVPDAAKCLGDALRLVNLSADCPYSHDKGGILTTVGDKGAQVMSGFGKGGDVPGARLTEKDLKPDSQTCSTDPLGIFQRLEGSDVRLIRVEPSIHAASIPSGSRLHTQRHAAQGDPM
jgi:hypothetical protein